MAYKFQLGAAKMSGSLVQEGALTAEGTLTAPSVSFANVSGLVGAGLANNSGVLDIDAGGVTNNMLSGAIDADKLKIDTNHFIANGVSKELEINFNASGGVTVKPTTGLEIKVAASGALQVDGSGLGISSGGVTNNMLSGAIDADKLRLGGTVESSSGELDVKFYVSGGLDAGGSGLEIKTDVSGGLQVDEKGMAIKLNATPGLQVDENGIGVRLAASKGLDISGGELTTTGVLEDLNAVGAPSSVGQLLVASGAGSFIYQSGASLRTTLGLGTSDSPTFTNLTLSGDLTVNGTQTIINSTAVEIADKNILLASGSADGNAANGAGLTIEGPEVQWKYSTNGLDDSAGTGADASSSGDIWMASGSSGLIAIQADKFYGGFVGDGASLTGVVATNSRVSINQIADSATDDIDAAGFWLGSQSQETTVTLNHASSWTNGDVVYIKSMNAGTYNVIIAPASGEDMEGVTNGTIVLESDGAAVTLIRAGGNAWYIV